VQLVHAPCVLPYFHRPRRPKCRTFFSEEFSTDSLDSVETADTADIWFGKEKEKLINDDICLPVLF
jgi:hypothetical protein